MLNTLNHFDKCGRFLSSSPLHIGSKYVICSEYLINVYVAISEKVYHSKIFFSCILNYYFICIINILIGGVDNLLIINYYIMLVFNS